MSLTSKATFRVVSWMMLVTVSSCAGVGQGQQNQGQRQPGEGTAELADRVILHNAKIYTVNGAQPWAEAIAIQSGKITAIGNEAEILAQTTNDTQVIDLQGRMVMPGFQDPHLHVLEAGMNENLCLVSDLAEAAQYIEEVQDCAAQQRDDAWVKASGANIPNLLDQERLPIEILDEAIPDRPVVILDDIGHGAWVNSKALAAVGYDETSSDPPGGILARDPETNQLTGVVLENADDLSPFVKAGSLMKQDLGQELGLDELLKMMTLNGAYLLYQEETTGSLDVGKWADLVVLDQNLFEVEVGAIANTKVLLTLLAGEAVYHDPALKLAAPSP